MVNPDSTSYPTLAVIQHHGLTGRDARALWTVSDFIGEALMSGDRDLIEQAEAFSDFCFSQLAQSIGMPGAKAVHDHLWRNVGRAVRWCRENARG